VESVWPEEGKRRRIGGGGGQVSAGKERMAAAIPDDPARFLGRE
jgi:hypothetical protein